MYGLFSLFTDFLGLHHGKGFVQKTGMFVLRPRKIVNARMFSFSTADDWPKVLSLRTLLVRSVQHLVTYTKMFVCISSLRIRLMASSLMSTNGVTALEPYIPFIKDY